MPLPTPEPRKNHRSVWFRGTAQPTYLTVRSRVGYFLGHWAPARGGSIRCDGEDCLICSSGQAARAFYYIWVELDNAEVKIFEIPERLKDIADQLYDDERDGVGVQMCVRKEGKSQNSPLAILITGRVDCEVLDIAPFVETLGHKRSSSTVAQTSQSRSQEHSNNAGAM